jgi:hypothetical protein
LERHNLLRSAPDRADALRMAARRLFERALEQGRPVSPTTPDASVQDELRALGYVQ